MRWLVGMRIGDEDRGALTFAGWMKGLAPQTEFLAQHTVEFGFRTLDPELFDKFDASAKEAARHILEPLGLADIPISVLQAQRPEANLARAAEHSSITGVLLGRKVRGDGLRVVRLGPVVRRLLRELPTPVVVAPNDVVSEGVGAGPVLLALDGSTDAIEAVRFARDFAATVDRELAVVHVIPAVPVVTAPYVPALYWTQAHEHEHTVARERLEKAIEALDLVGTRRVEGLGGVVPGIIDAAIEERACLIVCSSRELGVGARFFDTSVGSTLASYAPCPVAVVPSGVHADRKPAE